MSNDAITTLAALRDNVRSLAFVVLPVDYRPKKENIEVTTRGACNALSTEDGFSVKIRENDTAEDVLISLFHSAAHYLCDVHGVTASGRNGRHNTSFIQALEALGATAHFDKGGLGGVAIIPPNRTVKASARVNALQKTLDKRAAARTRHTAAASDRVTLKCPKCQYSLTLRRAASERVEVSCVQHARLMKESE